MLLDHRGLYFTHAHFLPARWRAPAGSTWRRERSTTRGSWSTRSCLSSPPLSAACRQSPGRCSRLDPPAASAQPPKVSTWLRRPSLKKEKTQHVWFQHPASPWTRIHFAPESHWNSNYFVSGSPWSSNPFATRASWTRSFCRTDVVTFWFLDTRGLVTHSLLDPVNSYINSWAQNPHRLEILFWIPMVS